MSVSRIFAGATTIALALTLIPLTTATAAVTSQSPLTAGTTTNVENVNSGSMPRSASITGSSKGETSKPIRVMSTATQNVGKYFALPLARGTYRVTSYWGNRCPVAPGSGLFHGAIDLAASDGTPIYAMMNGTVDSATTTGTPTLRINHGTFMGKNLKISYGHMWKPTQFVKVGQKVSKGQKVAAVGNAGVSNGPHVHLAVLWGGKAVNPETFFAKYGMDLKNYATHVAPKPAPISTCVAYTTASQGLKSSANNLASNVTVLPRGTKVTVRLGSPTNGFDYVTTSTGRKGWVHSGHLYVKTPKTLPALKYALVAKNVKWTPTGSRHLFDYPTSDSPYRGILDTVAAGETMVTTGRKYGNYTQVKFGNLTGWVVLEYVKRVFTIGTTGTTTKGALYKTTGSYHMYSVPTTETRTYYVTFTAVPANASVYTTGRTYGKFYEVKYNGKTGWMFTTVLKRATSR